MYYFESIAEKANSICVMTAFFERPCFSVNETTMFCILLQGVEEEYVY